MDRRGLLFLLAAVGATALVLVGQLAGGSDGEVDAATVSTVAPTTTAAPVTEVTAAVTTAPPTTAAPTTTVAPAEWTLLLGGDVLMDRSEPAGVDVFGAIEPPLETADLAIVNVEMAISERGTAVAGKEFVFRAPPSAAQRIADAGIDVASLANNHAKDYGSDALADTAELLTAAGVTPVGAGPDRATAFTPASLDVGGIRVAVIGVSYIVPGGFGATSDRSGVASGRDGSGAQVAAVSAAAAEHDVVLVYAHWGIERDTCPSGAQRDQAAELLAAGATVVIGAHPHVLQPIEQLDDGWVIWSLGNFVWHPRSGITGETAVVQVDFVESDVDGITVHPHLLDENGAPAPVAEGTRHDRIVDITSGDCERHDPPPLPTTTAPPTTVAPTETTAPPTTVAPTETTAQPETTVPTETTAPPTTVAPPETTAAVEATSDAAPPDGPEPAPEPEITGALPPEDLP